MRPSDSTCRSSVPSIRVPVPGMTDRGPHRRTSPLTTPRTILYRSTALTHDGSDGDARGDDPIRGCACPANRPSPTRRQERRGTSLKRPRWIRGGDSIGYAAHTIEPAPATDRDARRRGTDSPTSDQSSEPGRLRSDFVRDRAFFSSTRRRRAARLGFVRRRFGGSGLRACRIRSARRCRAI